MATGVGSPAAQNAKQTNYLYCAQFLANILNSMKMLGLCAR
jgi:hypothetical protein